MSDHRERALQLVGTQPLNAGGSSDVEALVHATLFVGAQLDELTDVAAVIAHEREQLWRAIIFAAGVIGIFAVAVAATVCAVITDRNGWPFVAIALLAICVGGAMTESGRPEK